MKTLFFSLLFFLFSASSFAQSTADDWWKKTTVYQIYPRSFYDTNADGIGDLEGIIQKLDFTQQLGFESIWISPFTQSPQRDFGYDISDYTAIDSVYGDTVTFKRLVEEIHRRGMHLIFDMVMNHTSDQHAWFKESSSSKENPKADWYIWKDGRGKDGLKRPNNWRSMVGDRAWQYHAARHQFYYHGFLPFQPDLNYNNAEVKKAMFDIVRFWLDKGVDGFRLDIISAIHEDSTLKNNPPSAKLLPSDSKLTIFFQYAKNNFLQEQSFGFATELRQVINEYQSPTRVLIGESHGEESLIKNFCKKDGKDGLHGVFLFKAISEKFDARKYAKMLTGFNHEFADPLIPTLVFGNHDRTRSIDRVNSSVAKAKLKALVQLTARGIPFVYNGEELGMPNVRIPLKEGKDAVAIANSKVPQFLADLSPETLNRDECRTPMLWSDQANAGFCDSLAQPWLPIVSTYKTINVANQLQDSTSLLNTYRKLLTLRKSIPALNSGSFTLKKDFNDKNILAYERTDGEASYLVLLNMSKKVKEIEPINGTTIFTTHSDSSTQQLQPYEGRIFQLEN